MEDFIEIEKYKGYDICIYHDTLDVSDPRHNDNLGTMVCLHDRFVLGDVQEPSSPNVNSWDEDMLYRFNDDNVIHLPLYIYEHSGITMNTIGFNCAFDSSRVGYIYVEREKVLKHFGWKYLTESRIETVKECLRNEVEVYDNYITGNIYGYIVKNLCDEDMEMCTGFYGSDHEVSGLLSEAKSDIDRIIDVNHKHRLELLKQYIKSKVPFEHRQLGPVP